MAPATPAPSPRRPLPTRAAHGRGSGFRLAVPGQHGAWAFLLVPLLLGFALVGWSPAGGLFASAWVFAYPASHYLGRAVVIRARRGTWTRLARRELRDALPWTLAALACAVPVALLRPWLVPVALGLAAAWAASLRLTRTGRERGLGNDLLLVAQASLAVPLLCGVVLAVRPLAMPPAAAAAAWSAAAVCLVFFTGSVLHVKSLIRGAGDRRWATASRVFHIALVVAALLATALSPWLLLPFGAAAVRAFAVPQGSRPAVIGGVEALVSVLVLLGAGLALG